MTNFLFFFWTLLCGAFAVQQASSEATSSAVTLCRRTCKDFHYKLVPVCKDLCAGGDSARLALRACVSDKPSTTDQLRECVQVKSDLDGAYTPGETLTAIGQVLSYVPAPGYLRDLFGAAGEFAEQGLVAYNAQATRAANTVARLTGQTAGKACYVVNHPLFTISGLTPLSRRSLTSVLNPLTQYVLFSDTATCKPNGEIEFLSGETQAGRGVAVVRGPRCGWPLPSPSELRADQRMVLFVDDDCAPIGHGIATWASNSSAACVFTATHVLRRASYFVYHFRSTTVVPTTEQQWATDGDFAYTLGCAPPSPLIPGESCTLLTYATGMGLSRVSVAVQHQAGVGLFGTVDRTTGAGSSGSPCVCPLGRVGLVSAVVHGGIELVPATVPDRD